LGAWVDYVSASLHDFIVTNRDQIIERARLRLRERMAPQSTEVRMEHGVPLFLSQLVEALAPASAGTVPPKPLDEARESKQINDSAALHGHDLLRNGYTVAQVVHGYGDVCQIVTELAGELNAPISTDDFQNFNRYLDDAIAGAVTAYGRQRESDLAVQDTERLGVFAHELRNLLNTAILSFDAIKRGTVGLGGSTGAVHSRSLIGLRVLIERSLSEVRMGKPTLEPFSVLEFIEEVALSAAMQADGHGIRLTVDPVASDLVVDADRHLLASALSNLLQNAFKFTRRDGRVVLNARGAADRVLIEVRDECGGLPPGKAEDLFRPFTRRTGDNPGLGLGLSIALGAVRASSGSLSVRDLPAHGCVFTIDLPRSGRPALSA
jgi:signal transduction histidine kinase